ncbi:type I polyketide synthase [Serratia microhaemolytica]|uniref:type I polyketide synthase n=1 Tax=Serratia microhaemolytica TaxID=2675110 RepID=UPI000FDDF64C|nr:type I polyketide synthase [Serratia microhaemolytica]
MSKHSSDYSRNSSGDIAIVAMATHFPDSANLQQFWQNIVNKKDSITDIDTVSALDYWKKEDFYHPDVTAADKTYAYKAGFVPEIDFDPVAFKIPPAIVDSISTAQLFALYTARQLMQDAGLLDQQNSCLDRDRIGVILGGGGNGNTSFSLAARQQAPHLREVMVKAGLSLEVAEEVIARVLDLYLEWNEDSFPGFLGNVACGRIASYFDLGGTSYMVDAACASSLAAIKAAIGELHSGSCDAVITGGLNLENSVFSFLCFSKTPALSKTNCSRPFDQQSDGIMLGDGIGMLLLKRLQDAEQAGDRIYAVIKSLEASSDGRAKSIFAPRYEGQVKALTRAYARAGIKPSDIQLIEAHGTGTISGDNTELKSLHTIFNDTELPAHSIAIGSIKSQIGHTRCAAGAASMIKVALALQQKVLPPSINVQQPVSALTDENSPFYLNSEPRPWLQPNDGAPRRAALSAFGFGGTNFHAILEEYRQPTEQRYQLNAATHILLLTAADGEQLLARCQQVSQLFNGGNAATALRQHLAEQDLTALPAEQARLVLVASSAEHAAQLWQTAVTQLRSSRDRGWEHPHGIYYQPKGQHVAGKVVALFPGQGSQYVNMARNIACDSPAMRQALETLDSLSYATRGYRLSTVIYPPPAFSDAQREQQRAHLTDTANAQPAIGAISAGYFATLREQGFSADFVVGHSYGELTALWAAGVLSDSDFYRASLARGHAAAQATEQANSGNADGGAMLAVALSVAAVQPWLASYPEVVLANDNATEQVVLGGSRAQIQALHQALQQHNIQCRLLPVSAAFHTPLLQAACAPFLAELSTLQFHPARCRVFSSAAAAEWSNDPTSYANTLAAQMIQPVRFRETIEAIYQQGGRVFVEFGPKGVLGKLVADILKQREHTLISLNISDNGEESLQLARAQARLLAYGMPLHGVQRYLRPLPVTEDLSRRLSYRLSGGFYFSEKNQRRRQHALREGDTAVVDRFIAEQKIVAEPRSAVVAQIATPTPAPASVGTTDSASFISTHRRENDMEQMNSLIEHPENRLQGLLHAQQMMSQLHHQFQHNQQEYIQLLNALLNKQCALLEGYRDHPHLATMLASLGQSIQLLDKNLELYHTNHQHYFATQQSLFQSEQHPVALATAHMTGASSATASRVTGHSSLAYQPTQGGQSTVASNLAVTGPTASSSAPFSAPVAPMSPVAAMPAASPVAVAPASTAAPTLTPLNSPLSTRMPSVADVTLPSLTAATMPSSAANTPPPVLPTVAAPQSVAPSNPQPRQPAVAAAPSASDETQLAAQIAQLNAITSSEISTRLIKVISERTGYLQEMIEPTMDLEADLGIDSIKRMEIFGAIFDTFLTEIRNIGYPIENDDAMMVNVESLSSIEKMSAFFRQMIDEMVADLQQRLGGQSTALTAQPAATGSSTAPSATANSQPVAASATADSAPHSLGFVASTADQPAGEALKKPLAEPQQDSVPVVQPTASDLTTASTPATVERFTVGLHSLPIADANPQTFAGSHHWLIVDEGKTFSDELASQLRTLGQQVTLLALTASKSKNRPAGCYELLAADESGLDQVISDIEQQQGGIDGVIWLQNTAKKAKSAAELFDQQGYHSLTTTFLLARRLQPSLDRDAQQPSWFFVITRGDGQFSLSGQRGLTTPLPASVTGLTKALNVEWKSAFCRTVDIDARLKNGAAVRALLEELQDRQQDLAEVGRGVDGSRVTLALYRQTRQEQAAAAVIDQQDLLLVTGGGRGVTASCVIALAQRHQTRFVLLGRTDIEAPLPDWATGAQTVAERKAAAIAHLQASGIQPTPVKINNMLSGLLHRDEILNTLQQLCQLGSEAVYHCCDITDRAQLSNVVKQVQQQHGAISGIIHGAGNLADKRIEKKTLADLSLVFDSKVKGLDNLCQVLDVTTLRHIILFSSVSSFFGNAGQTDYSLANEALNKFAWLPLQKAGQPVVRAINWGPLQGGMVNDTLKRAYDRLNMLIIPLETGRTFFVHEFDLADQAQVVIGGDNYRVKRALPSARFSNQSERLLTLNHNRFLQHHVINQHPVLPATAAIAWMVRVCQEQLPGYQLVTVSDFMVLKGIVFDGNQAERYHATLEPVPNAQPDDTLTFNVVISGLLAEKTLAHYQARLSFAQQAASAPCCAPAGALDVALPLPAPLYGDMTQGALLFHGESFRGIEQLLQSDQQGMLAKARLPQLGAELSGQFPTEGFNLYVYDVALQMLLLWLMLHSDKAGLPTSIGQIRQYRPITFDQSFYITMQVTQQTASSLQANCTLHDEQGNVYSDIEAATFTVSKAFYTLFTGASQQMVQQQ